MERHASSVAAAGAVQRQVGRLRILDAARYARPFAPPGEPKRHLADEHGPEGPGVIQRASLAWWQGRARARTGRG